MCTWASMKPGTTQRSRRRSAPTAGTGRRRTRLRRPRPPRHSRERRAPRPPLTTRSAGSTPVDGILSLSCSVWPARSARSHGHPRRRSRPLAARRAEPMAADLTVGGSPTSSRRTARRLASSTSSTSAAACRGVEIRSMLKLALMITPSRVCDLLHQREAEPLCGPRPRSGHRPTRVHPRRRPAPCRSRRFASRPSATSTSTTPASPRSEATCARSPVICPVSVERSRCEPVTALHRPPSSARSRSSRAARHAAGRPASVGHPRRLRTLTVHGASCGGDGDVLFRHPVRGPGR